MSILRDLSFGNKNETIILEKLQETFPDIIQTETFHPFDYFNTDTFFELKSRRCNHDTYPDTMIGHNKIKYALDNPQFNYVFLFKFLDGLYKHHFDPTRNYELRKGGRMDRGKPEFRNYAYIPIDELTFIS